MNLYIPPFSAKVAPVFWEPHSGSGERIVALVLITPEQNTANETPSLAHVVFPAARLRALLGNHRATSAEGILRQVSIYMTDELSRGKTISEATAPFQGFTVGKEVRVLGYSFEQLLDSAIRTVSVFGTSDGLYDESSEDSRHTITTSRFIKSLRAHFSNNDQERKSRFSKPIQRSALEPVMTIDYAHLKHLVQVTSLPLTERQVAILQKEAESKILELDITVNSIFAGSPVAPALLINTEGLYSPDATAKQFASDFFERIRYMGEKKDARILEARSPQRASALLEELI